jgi:hypothetical protein
MHRLVTYAVILAMGAAGYANGPAWLVPAAAACLTLDDWRLWRLGRQVRASWSSKTTTYLVTGVVADLALAAIAFGAGRTAHLFLG